MFIQNREKNGTDGATRISIVLVAGWLIFGWARPAFSDETRHLELAPIQMGAQTSGDLGYIFESYKTGTNKTSSQALGVNVRTNIQARTYFWQPWLAQISSSLGVGLSSSTVSSSSSSTKNRSMATTGDAALELVKYSRFPFKAHVFKGMNHATGSAVSRINPDVTNSGYDLSQKYRNLSGRVDILALYLHNASGRTGFGEEDIRDQLDFSAGINTFKYQTISLYGTKYEISHPAKGDRYKMDSWRVNHVYQPISSLSVTSMVNVISTRYTLQSSIIPLLSSSYSAQQLSSFASWRPVGTPLTLTSSVRLLKSTIDSNNSAVVNADTANFNLGANYAWSRLLRMYGSVNVSDISGLQTVTTNAALSAQKMFGENPDAVNLGGFRYSRFAGASISNSTTTTSGSNNANTGNTTQTTNSTQTLAGNIGHDLIKKTDLGGGLMTIDLNQRLSEAVSTSHSPSSRLSSSGSLSWSQSEGRNTTIIRTRASDSRSLTGNQNFFQLINLQATRNIDLLNSQSLIGNLTIQTSRSGSSGTSTPFVTTPSANLMYQNARVFHVKNLTFNSTLNVIGAEIVSSQSSPNPLGVSTDSTASASWDNDMHYFIGKLDLSLYYSLVEANRTSRSILRFTMKRAF